MTAEVIAIVAVIGFVFSLLGTAGGLYIGGSMVKLVLRSVLQEILNKEDASASRQILLDRAGDLARIVGAQERTRAAAARQVEEIIKAAERGDDARMRQVLPTLALTLAKP